VCLHAAAGDVAAQDGQRGMTALDVVGCIRQVVR
jgi:NAD(P)H-hydrate repair Nnr-like enzyme with NAD(P)H-hydrate dehydratase domain